MHTGSALPPLHLTSHALLAALLKLSLITVGWMPFSSIS